MASAALKPADDSSRWDNNAPLTAQLVKSLEPHPTNRRERRDGQNSNLWLLVQPKSGTKSWVYRGSAMGEEFKEKLGTYPMMSLADARTAHDALRVRIAKNDFLPPKLKAANDAKQVERVTVADAWSDYMESNAVVGKVTDKEVKAKTRFYDRDIFPAIGTKALADVTFEDIAGLIVDRYDTLIEEARQAGKETNGASANRLHACCSKFLNWCAYDTIGRVRTKLQHNPMGKMSKPTSNGVRKRALEEWEIVYLFRALDKAGEFAKPFEALLRSICRRSSILAMTWREVRTDDVVLEDTKNGEDHWFYMTDSFRALLGQRGEADKTVFGLNVDACSNPMRRVRERMQELAIEDGKTILHWTLHDFRRTATGFLADYEENGVKPFDLEVRELLLGHKRKGVERNYQVSGLRAQRRYALTVWGDYLDGLKAQAAKIALDKRLIDPSNLVLTRGVRDEHGRPFCWTARDNRSRRTREATAHHRG